MQSLYDTVAKKHFQVFFHKDFDLFVTMIFKGLNITIPESFTDVQTLLFNIQVGYTIYIRQLSSKRCIITS